MHLQHVMANPLKFNFELKNSSEDMTLLSITFTWQHKRNKVCLGVKVPPCDWDKKMHEVVITSKQTQAMQRKMRKVNRFLREFEKAVAEINVDIVNEGYELHGNIDKMANLIKDKLALLEHKDKKEEEQRAITPVEFFEQLIKEMPTKIN